MNKETRKMIQDDLPYLVCRGDEVLGAFTTHGDAEMFLTVLQFKQDWDEKPYLWIDCKEHWSGPSDDWHEPKEVF